MIDYLEPNVIIVDDVREEINGIYSYYVNKGIGCKVFNPDLFEGDEYPTSPFSDVNIIYLDLHYSSTFEAERCVSWIRHLVKAKSFYILVIWTKDISKSSQVSELLNTHNVTPFLTLIKSKSDYANTEGYDFTLLFEQIDEELNRTPALEEMFIWKKAIRYSSNEVFGHLAKDSSIITDKLKKIIVSHGGNSIIESADENKRNILFDALDIVLISNTRKNADKEINNLNSQSLYDLTKVQDAGYDKELNSWFHFKLGDNIRSNLIFPGVIAKNNHGLFKKLYSIQDDPKVEQLLKNQKDISIIFEDIVVVISRPCDIAQKKYGKNIKLLSGLIAYQPKRKKGIFELNGTKIDSLKIYDHLYYDSINADITMLFDFRYSFSVPESIFIKRFENVKIFNKELLSEIQVEYSTYSSRLGITQII